MIVTCENRDEGYAGHSQHRVSRGLQKQERGNSHDNGKFGYIFNGLGWNSALLLLCFFPRPRVPGICGLVIQFYSNMGHTVLTTALKICGHKKGTTWKLWFDPALSRKRASRNGQTAKYLQEYFFRIVTPKSLQNLYKVNELELKKKQSQRDRHGGRTAQDPSKMSREIFDVEIQQLQQLRPALFFLHPHLPASMQR
ncbi:hypothetical protein GX48_05446 [Paracoccidioides brasiliensis]|nr:hypothetical protein GX48_05446 [Paracoccidioides brasiliensis]